MFERDKSYIFLVAFSLEALFVHRSNVVLSKMIRKLHHSQKKNILVCPLYAKWHAHEAWTIYLKLLKVWSYNLKNECLTIYVLQL